MAGWYESGPGSVYALSALGPERESLVKIGQTTRCPLARIDGINWELWSHGPAYLWAVKSADRLMDEREVHRRLSAWLEPGLFGYVREAFVVPMARVILAMQEVTQVEPVLLWTSWGPQKRFSGPPGKCLRDLRRMRDLARLIDEHARTKDKATGRKRKPGRPPKHPIIY